MTEPVVGRRTLIVIGVAAALLAIFLLSSYTLHWSWTGLPSHLSPVHSKDQDYEREKTLWDWLQLLIIPAVLAVGTIWFNAQQGKASARIAEDQQREAALQTYISHMSDLLLRDNLGISKRGPVQAVARGLTLTTLRNLDPHRKVVLLRFLYDSRLVDQDDAKVDLRGANLNNVRLDHTALPGIALRGAKLRGSHLQETNLTAADLGGADLRNAILQQAILRGINLGGSRVASASSPDSGAERPGPTMTAGLDNNQLPGADLTNVDLTEAILDDATIDHAIFVGAIVTEEQLRSTRSRVGVVQ